MFNVDLNNVGLLVSPSAMSGQLRILISTGLCRFCTKIKLTAWQEASAKTVDMPCKIYDSFTIALHRLQKNLPSL